MRLIDKISTQCIFGAYLKFWFPLRVLMNKGRFPLGEMIGEFAW